MVKEKFVDPSREVLHILKRIRSKYYPEFKAARIITLMRNGKWSKWGTISRVTEAHRKAGIFGDYILTLNNDAWSKFSTRQKKALVDHELAHMVKKEGKKGISWKLRHHDVEEFNSIVKRYGEWTPSLTKFRKSFR